MIANETSVNAQPVRSSRITRPEALNSSPAIDYYIEVVGKVVGERNVVQM
jgi:hypothetical protein